MPCEITSASGVYRRIRTAGTKIDGSVNKTAIPRQNRSISVMVFLSASISCIPQNRAVITLAPMPIPIQQIWNRLTN